MTVPVYVGEVVESSTVVTTVGPALDRWLQLVDRWLDNRRLSPQTRRAYRLDLGAWLHWCAARDLDPRGATFIHANDWGRELESVPTERTGQPMAPASVVRRMGACGAFHDFLVALDIVTKNPFTGADRPKVDKDHTVTVSLDAAEAAAIIRAADADRGAAAARTRALVRAMLTTGARVAELAALDVGDYRTESGHRVLALVGKGGKRRTTVVPPMAASVLDEYLAGRADGAPAEAPLFATATGGRIDQQGTMRLVQRLARAAGVPSADRLSPHSMRHAFASLAHANGVSIDDLQQQLGHADPRTTRRYARARLQLDQSAGYSVAAALAAVPAPR